MISSHRELLRKLEEMEKKYDEQFQVVFEAIRQLMTPPEPPRKRIGFEAKEAAAPYGKGKSSRGSRKQACLAVALSLWEWRRRVCDGNL
jgi:hypothetical protein